MKRLKWEGLTGFNKLRWTALDDPASPGVTGAFFKTYKNFAFYWILKAGHMVRLQLMQFTLLLILERNVQISTLVIEKKAKKNKKTNL